ncbi:histidine phosphatase family protein [bacterium]|nr:histidine phosphatase family protein [bacterium]
MKIYLLRHGQRSAGYGDVSLSSEGLQQAQKLAVDPFLQDCDILLCSPKIRTRQTAEPLCERLEISLQIVNDLDQRKSIETENEFTNRVLSFLKDCTEKFAGKNILLCSHSDWLQTALMNLPLPLEKAVAQSFFSCGEYRTLTYKDNTWDLL